MKVVNFPGLGLYFNINQVAFRLFGLDIYWYAIIISSGLILAFLYISYLAKKQGYNSEVFLDVILIGLPAAIVGARLYYVFSKWDYYSNNLIEIFNTRNGGMAIYGGIIAAVIAVYIFLKVKKENILNVFDFCSIGLLIGQSIGRWGNFVNVEAYGYETTLPWRMEIYSNELAKLISVHPTFLYESLWNIIGAFFLSFLIRKRKFFGEIFFIYISWYGLGRFFIEGLRTDSLMFYSFRVSQIVAIASIIVGISLYIYYYLKNKKSDTI